MHRNGLDSTKKSYKNDILLILFFLIIGIGAFAFMQLQGKSGAEVKVSVNNKEYGIYSLDKNQTVTIGEDDWENILIMEKPVWQKQTAQIKFVSIMQRLVKRERPLSVFLIKWL